MDRSFIRMQMLAKLEEFCFYSEKYLKELNKERKVIGVELTEEELKEFDDMTQQIFNFKHSSSEIIDEIDVIAIRLKSLYEEYVKRHNSKVIEYKNKYSFEYEGVTIKRKPLQYSTFAISLGYDADTQLMDIEFKGGKIYRYKNVPEEFYLKASVKNSLRDLKQELSNFEFVTIKEK